MSDKMVTAEEIDAEIFALVNDDDVFEQIEALLTAEKFVEFSGSPAYVDKTLLIEVILKCSQQTLITAPRRFSKTSNLRMMQAFFSLEKGTLDDRRKAFEKCKISKRVKAMEHFGSYPVIYVDFSYGNKKFKDDDSVVIRCREIMYRAFADHGYLFDYFKSFHESEIPLELENLPGESENPPEEYHYGIKVSELNRWLRPDLFGEPSTEMVTRSLVLLAKCLKFYHKKKPIVLIDEFDSMCNDALFSCDEPFLNEIILFYSTMTGNLLKCSKSSYYKAVLTGITSVICKGLTTLTDLVRYKFLRSNKFAPFYGLTHPEFKELLNREGLKERKKQEEAAFEFYNGYEYKLKRGTKCPILNLMSIVRFLAFGNVGPYWDGSGQVTGLSETIRSDKVIQKIHTLLGGGTLKIKYMQDTHNFEPSKLATFNQVAKDPTKEFTDTDFLFNFLLQQGYVRIHSEEGDYVNIKIPNIEAHCALLNIIRNFYVTVCGYNDKLLTACGDCLVALNQSNVDVDMKMNELCLYLEHVVRKKEKHTNEYWFEHLLFYIVFMKRGVFEVDTQEKVGEQKNVRKRKRYDVLISAKTETKTDFLFELKIGTLKKPPENALNQIITKKYHTACKSSRYFLIGITLINDPENNSIEIEYLHNTTDLTQRKSCNVESN